MIEHTEVRRFETVIEDGIPFLLIGKRLVCVHDLYLDAEDPYGGAFAHPSEPSGRAGYFTQPMAQRAALERGLRVPYHDEWMEILLEINPDVVAAGWWSRDLSVRGALGLELGGILDEISGKFQSIGIHGYYWTASRTDSDNRGFVVGCTQEMFGPWATLSVDTACRVRCIRA